MKKLITKLMAAAFASSCLVSATANAGYSFICTDSGETLDDFLDGYTRIYSEYNQEYGNTMQIYCNDMKRLTRVNGQSDKLCIEIVADTDENGVAKERKDVEELIGSYLPSAKIEVIDEHYDEYTALRFNVMAENKNYVLQKSKEIKKAVSEIADVKEVTYAAGMIYAERGNVWTPSGDITEYESLTEEKAKEIEQYVEENNLDFTVETTFYQIEFPTECFDYYRCHLIPNQDISMEEHFAVAKQIEDDLDVHMNFVWECSFNNFSASDIDILNSIDGDANEDGKVNMADATAIIQHIGNSDKYGLTPQGEFNADADGDGLTGVDAIEIQMKVAEAGMPE